jgi:arginyl-tRNA synthetase
MAEVGIKTGKNIEIKLERPAEISFGDWSCNIAMLLAKAEKKNPRELAEKIIAKIKKAEMVEKIEVAGAGFINFYLKREYLVKQAEKANYESEFRAGMAEMGLVDGKRKKMVIDYSAPNIAKPFGIGHLRSTNIGQAIYNLYRILGWECIGDNHLGDWGTQFGKLIAAIKLMEAGDKRFVIDENGLTVENLEKLYVAFHKEAESDESLVEAGRDWFAKLENGDKEARKIWQKMIDVSMVEFDKVYKMLGVNIDTAHGESFYEPMLRETIEIIEKKGIAKKSQGALIVEFDDMPPAMLSKSNGTTTYLTRDLATIRYRQKEWEPDLIIYEVGADQKLHFRQLFAIAKMMGWDKNCQFVHIAHGLLRWKNAKFSTRKGDTVHLTEVIERAKAKAEEIAKTSESLKKMGTEEREISIETVAIGAIKFNDLLSEPKKDIIFDWERVMSLEGNSGPYLQYTYARALSVLEKSKIREQKNLEMMPEKLEVEEEKLLKLLGRLEEKIVEAQERLAPSVLAEYLLEVARAYNEFYAKYRIVGETEETERVFLTRTMASVLEWGMGILGIGLLEKM